MSSSILTRVVMRRILANQPIHHHHLVSSYRSPRRLPIGGSLYRPRAQIRSIFSILAKKATPVSTAYNLSKEEMTIKRHTKSLQEAYMLLRVNTRTAPKPDLAKTFKDFFKECDDAREMITDHQAGILLKVFELLKSTEQGDVAMTVEIARTALLALSKFDHGRHDVGSLRDNPPLEDSYWILAQQLSSFLQKNDTSGDLSDVADMQARCLAQSGHADLAETHMRSIKDLETWKIYVKAQFQDPSSMLSTLKAFQEFGVEADDELNSLFIQGFIHAGQSDLARRMLHGSGLLKLFGSSLQPAVDILKVCLLHDDSPTTIEIIAKTEAALERDPQKTAALPAASSWFDLYVLHQIKNKGVEAFEKVLDDLRLRYNYLPTITTFNLLIKEAYQGGDSNLAKNIIEFAKKRELDLTGYTFLPQVLHKLRNGDLDGALATWDYILYDLEAPEPEHMAEPMEELLLGILSAPELRDDQFDEILHNHPKYARRFSPETVAALLEFYLRREEYENVAFLMRKHAPHATSDARAMLLDRAMTICRDDAITDECVANIYTMIKALFDDSNRSIREEILEICIKRNLVEKALEIFKDMRDHWLNSIKPTEATYIIALNGLSSSSEAVSTIHNSLKLDTLVDPSTDLLNSLMRAYTKCGQDEARTAVDFWDELLEMDAGPNEDSVVAVLEACSVSPAGYQQAKYVWDTLPQRGIAITARILGAYVNNFMLTGSEETHTMMHDELSKNELSQNIV